MEVYEACGSEKRGREVFLAPGTAETSGESSIIKDTDQNGGWDGGETTGQTAVSHRPEGKQLLCQAGLHENSPHSI